VRKKHLIAVASTVLLVISEIASGGAEAAPFEPGPPLSPVGLQPLSPVGQQNAVRAAQQYLSVTAFSRSGLIDQLVTIDGYSSAQAQYGVAVAGY
jgi:hypothetical protein